MQRAAMWQQPQRSKQVAPETASVRKMLGWPILKSRAVPAAPSVPCNFKSVEMVDLDDFN